MPPNKPAILITAAINDALLQQLPANNFSVDVIPFIETKSIQNKIVEAKILRIANTDTTVVFTSSNAVKTVQHYLQNIQVNWKVYCVGENTKQLVEEAFENMQVTAFADNARQLAQLIITNKPGTVYFFCGDKRRDELPVLLTQHNIAVNEVEVYETIILHHKVEKNYDGIIFFSPSAVRGFFKNNVIDDATVLFAIGKTTADEILKFSNNKIVVSGKPGKGKLIKEVFDSFY